MFDCCVTSAVVAATRRHFKHSIECMKKLQEPFLISTNVSLKIGCMPIQNPGNSGYTTGDHCSKETHEEENS